MAKTIKAIKCPQCGSTQAQKQDEDQYICGSCGTHYFIDSDDITIHHKHEDVGGSQPWLGKRFIFALLAGIFALLFAGVTQCSKFGSKTTEASYSSSEGSTSSLVSTSWDIVELVPFVGSEGEPLVLAFMRPDLRSKGLGAAYAVIDTESGQELFHSAIEGVEKFDITDKVEAKQFANGRLNIIVKESKWYEFDPKSYALEEVSIESYKHHEALASGIATFGFVYEDEGDGLKLMTNLGKEIYYYPIIDKVYTRDELYDARGAKLPNPQDAVGYRFTGSSAHFQDAEIQLIRYSYKVQEGYPMDLPNFSKQKDFGRSGIFTDSDPYKVVLITDYSAKRSRLTGFSVINSGAHYFSPLVLWSGSEGALIAYKPTAAPEEKYLYQQIDDASGKPLWTAPAPEELKKTRPSSAMRTPSGKTLIVFSDTAWLLDSRGETIGILDLEP